MPVVTEHAQGMPCWIDASVSTSQQREGLINFYSALFGWTFDVDAPETGFYSIARHIGKAVLGIESDAQEGMTILRRGEQWFAGLSHEDSTNQPPQWTPVFVVDSLDRIKNRVRDLGGSIVVEEMPVPGSAISIFQDPIVGTYVTVMRAGDSSGS